MKFITLKDVRENKELTLNDMITTNRNGLTEKQLKMVRAYVGRAAAIDDYQFGKVSERVFEEAAADLERTRKIVEKQGWMKEFKDEHFAMKLGYYQTKNAPK